MPSLKYYMKKVNDLALKLYKQKYFLWNCIIFFILSSIFQRIKAIVEEIWLNNCCYGLQPAAWVNIICEMVFFLTTMFYDLQKCQNFEQEMSQLFFGNTFIQLFLKMNFQYIKVHWNKTHFWHDFFFTVIQWVSSTSITP